MWEKDDRLFFKTPWRLSQNVPLFLILEKVE